ncbi:MAG: formylglycine-generating enzyme family protein [Gammaproteobacteria bacterium]|nr:formylglycine-generating enzyme family protein [Gammaproteobacteria bacterium]
MSEYQTTEHERWLLDQARANDANVVALAKHLVLLPRVEPLLLRNVRLRFVPSAHAETESRLWFSPLVSVRSTQNFILHRGIAMVLAQELHNEDPEQFTALWTFCQTHTHHWAPLEHLERDLRHALFREDRGEIAACLREMLRRIHDEKDEDKRIDLARWAKRNLPAFMQSPMAKLEETQWLAQYAATTLSDTAKWTELSQPEPLPAWLSEKLPPPLSETRIGLQLRFDKEKQQQVLTCLEPSDEVEILRLSSPLPGRLFVQCDGTVGSWYTVNIGSRMLLPMVCETIHLTTLEGQRYKLKVEIKPEDVDISGLGDDLPLYLSYVEADTQQAQELQQWLTKHSIVVKLLLERPGEFVSSDINKKARLMRLWTSAAQRLWADIESEQQRFSTQSLLLRTEDIPLPEGVNTASQLLDMIDWQRNRDHEVARQFVARITTWLSHESIESTGFTADTQSLLRELNNPETTPPRRLEIGDLLAERGDPRPGVGVAEFEVVVYPPEIQNWLDELSDIRTEPPRRLTIGDQLAERGDPRPGVGLDENRLPDIDWVQIPAGAFVYGEGKSEQHLALDTFYISRFTITNIQYQTFIDDGGYKNERWWRDLKNPEAEESGWSHPNRPKTNVAWYEAVAFCRWLSVQLGDEIQLPTEQQWEKAARGSDGRHYPWGQAYQIGYANVNEKAKNDGSWCLKETTAVGVYPQGNSPLGIADMAGNVWEWCLNKHDTPEVSTADISGRPRVLRGGSWFFGSENARAFARNGDYPDGRDGSRGFRVCCVLPSSGR